MLRYILVLAFSKKKLVSLKVPFKENAEIHFGSGFFKDKVGFFEKPHFRKILGYILVVAFFKDKVGFFESPI